MVTGHATTDDGTNVLIVGLTAENVERLMRGQPILLTRQTHGPFVPKGMEIVLLYGQDEASIRKTLEPSIHPGTKFYRDERMNDPPRENNDG